MTTLASDSLDILHVSKHYAQRGAALAVLDDVSLHVRAGEFVTIVGSSGCGKSTLLRLIAGLDTDYAGEIRAGAERVHDTSLQRGIVFQDHRLFPWLTVAQNIEAALRNAPLDAAAKRRAVADHIALVGLNGFEHAYPNQLSGGMAQRVAIARGLVNRPRVLLLDEPAAGLDPTSRLELRELLRGFAAAGGTVLISSHDLSELDEIAEDAVFVDRGEVVGGERLVLARQAAREWRIRALDPQALSYQLAHIGVAFDRVRIDGDVAHVALDREEDAADVLGRLVRAGVPITHFAPAVGDIERTYLSLAGGRR